MILAVGCGTSTAPGPAKFGLSVTGQVSLYDELGNQLPLADQVLVSALSMSSIRQYQTVTDASGRFELELPDEEAVPLLFSRDGFGDMFRYDIEEETQPIQVRLFARSSATVTAVQPMAVSCGLVNCLALALEVDDFFRPDATRRIFRLYLSTDSAVTFFDYQFTDVLVVPNDQSGLVQTGSDATFELDGLDGLLGSFTTGTTVHLLVYGATENLTHSYTVPGTDLEIFTDISTVLSTASFIIL